jgi:Xaa-Pro aminopeptidase
MKNDLIKLQNQLKLKKIDIYLIPQSDFHNSEYIGDHFKEIEFISNFTGSNATLVVTTTEAFLFTDGRYFLQAERELKGTGIKLMKMGNPGVMSVEALIASKVVRGTSVAFNGKLVTYKFAQKLNKIILDKGGKLKYDLDLVSSMWDKRPKLISQPIYELDMKHSGETRAAKLLKIRTAMKEHNANLHVVASLDNIGYILNLRGRDIANSTVFYSYLLISEKSAILFVDNSKLTQDLIDRLKADLVEIKPYDNIYSYLSLLSKPCLIDPLKVNYLLYKSIRGAVVEGDNPSMHLKSIKNEVEISNMRKAHLMDGVAATKFIYYVKTNVKGGKLTEANLQDKLLELRSLNTSFLSPSFESIVGYQENGALIHYHVDRKNPAVIKPKGLLLVDSGGHYLNGTTDITRTIVVGDISKEQTTHFSLVLEGMLSLASAKFLEGASGTSLDILARAPLWNELLNFRHGTGHGIGHIGEIHEPPIGFRYNVVAERYDSSILKENMTITNEPGLYIEGQYGIRHENIMLIKKLTENEYGKWLSFEMLTLAPFDVDGIDKKLISKNNLSLLNWYHSQVYKQLSPHLTTDEAKWLKEVTKPI